MSNKYPELEYYRWLLTNYQKQIDKTDFMATKIKETEILVEYGYATENELKALKDKYVEAIRSKNELREKIREAETKLQEERIKIINGEVE